MHTWHQTTLTPVIDECAGVAAQLDVDRQYGTARLHEWSVRGE